jgi:hypothetical protein
VLGRLGLSAGGDTGLQRAEMPPRFVP